MEHSPLCYIYIDHLCSSKYFYIHDNYMMCVLQRGKLENNLLMMAKLVLFLCMVFAVSFVQSWFDWGATGKWLLCHVLRTECFILIYPQLCVLVQSSILLTSSGIGDEYQRVYRLYHCIYYQIIEILQLSTCYWYFTFGISQTGCHLETFVGIQLTRSKRGTT